MSLQVRRNTRAAITIPEKAWSRMRDNIDDYIQKMTIERQNTRSSSAVAGSSGQDEQSSMVASGTETTKT